MKTKDRVLEILQNNSNRYVSGEEMAEALYVTRAAVWKAIKSLKNNGYDIEAVTNRGYRLHVDLGLPNEYIIRDELNEALKGAEVNRMLEELEVKVYDEVTSTNDVARLYAMENPSKRALIIATSQSKGRGRRGRSFYSPKGTGLYLSLLIYPDLTATKATRLTSMMAVALARAIEDCTGISTSIKWVNDIYYDGKKVAGILTEAISSMEDEMLAYVIIGVGINLYMPSGGFPDDIKNIAGALYKDGGNGDAINRLSASLIYRFNQVINEPRSNYLEEYRNRSMLIGNYVKVMQYTDEDVKTSNEYAYVTGIDDECHLCVRYDDGRELILSTGEVSVVKY